VKPPEPHPGPVPTPGYRVELDDDTPTPARALSDVDPLADRPLYRQLADLIRGQIQRGEFAAGQRLPAQHDYVHEHGVSRDTVDRAMTILRQEGLIVTSRRGSRVRRPPSPTVMHVAFGRVSARIPTEPERRRHGIGEGMAVLVIKRDDHDDVILPADEVEIHIPHPCDTPPGQPRDDSRNE
jgi:DNA-binding transcriptional MocR family regulator